MDDRVGLLQHFAAGERHVMWVLERSPAPVLAYVSPAYEAVFGRPRSALAGQPWIWALHIHPDDRDAVEAAAKAWLADPAGAPFDVEYRILHPDGAEHWIRDCAQHRRGEEAQAGCLTGIAENITERRRAQQALRDQHERLETIAEVSPAYLCSFRVEADGRVSFPFGAARMDGFYGLPPGTVARDGAAIFAMVHPDDAGPNAEAIRHSARTLTPWRNEVRMRLPDGSMKWIEGHTAPVASADGAITWHGTVSDITPRKQVEQALLNSRARLAAVVAHMTEGLVICSADGHRHVEWNPAALALCEMDAEEARRLSFDQAMALFELRDLDGRLLPPEERPLPMVMAGQPLQQRPLRLRHLQRGWEKVLSYSGARIDGDDGRPLFGLIQMHDVTARRRHEEEIARLNAELETRVAQRTEELQAAVKELEAFSYSVSHDLRAPLRALDGFSKALLDDHAEALPDEGRRYVGIIRDATRRMAQLIDDLLDFSRLGRAPLNRRTVDTVQLVRHCFDALAHQREGRDIELRLGDLPPCEADLALLRQVWINLLANAIKYSRTRERAVIEVAFEASEGRAEYVVRDNGVGFDMRYAHKLFGVFERLHRAEEFEGTGVGLAIVQRIVQRHGGAVRAHSAPGQGASFHFTLG